MKCRLWMMFQTSFSREIIINYRQMNRGLFWVKSPFLRFNSLCPMTHFKSNMTHFKTEHPIPIIVVILIFLHKIVLLVDIILFTFSKSSIIICTLSRYSKSKYNIATRISQ
uniref:Uncharacterized protein n=1 Tax=Cacopsylla melanoneura TaxID=428564 RepID=A0A8D8WGT9_9HEMI